MMKKTIFREYDIRGIVGTELIINEVYGLGRAIALYLMTLKDGVKTIALAMDGREHSSVIKDNMCRALIDSGLDVIFIGVCTSPMMYFATYTLPVDGGVMITASHNPKEYNGFKICLGTQSLWGEQIREIGELYYAQKQNNADSKGTYKEQLIKNNYIAWHVEKFDHLKNADIAAVIDCGNGAAGVVMPEIIEKMQWKNVELLCADVDGTFPNHEADPTTIKNMKHVQDTMQKTGAAVGIGFDGDADRMGAMTQEGHLVPGDKMIALFAQAMIKKYPAMTVVYNVVCSVGLTELLEQWGAKTVMTPVGHSIIEENMHRYHALLGGETSCHFFFKDRHFGYDDGIYAMFRFIELLVESKKSVTELLEVFPLKVTSPEYRIACDEENKYAIVNDIKECLYQQKNAHILAIDGVRMAKDYGWGIIRASNTQPVLSIRFEANTEHDLQRIKEDFMGALTCHFDQKFLREQLQMQ